MYPSVYLRIPLAILWVGLARGTQTTMAAPYHTTLYENLFLLRVSICFSETPVVVERREEREVLTWRPHSSSPNVSLAMESCEG